MSEIKMFGSLVSSKRIKKRLTQRELAEIIGIHRVTLVKFENGQCDIMASHALKLIKYLKIKTGEL